MKIFNLMRSAEFRVSIDVLLSSFNEQVLIDKLNELQVDKYGEYNIKMSLKNHYHYFSVLHLKKISKLNITSQPDLNEQIKFINDEIEIRNKVIDESFEAEWNIEFLRWCELKKVQPEYFDNNKGDRIEVYNYYITSNEFVGDVVHV